MLGLKNSWETSCAPLPGVGLTFPSGAGSSPAWAWARSARQEHLCFTRSASLYARGQNEHKLREGFSEFDAALRILRRGEGCCLVGMSLIVSIKADLVCPKRHFFCYGVLFGRFVNPGIQSSFCVTLGLQHG